MELRALRRIEQLYHAALERAPADREAYLAGECGSDEALRHEVLSLLAHAHDADKLMERPAVEAGTEKLALLMGTRLGPYEVLGLVGAGGMGEVYRARDTRLGREVAIKVLPETAACDSDALARFDREARAVAALNHQHIATLFDIGEHAGTHYLVMELLDGETLAARVARKALKEDDARRIGADIAEALAAAHRQGVVHRDVKPANIVLTRAGAKLLDFGLARLQPAAGPPVATQTETRSLTTSALAGTLPYMAPEQLEGREADMRTDIWALGCVLFEMLAGRRAFEGDSQAGLIAAIEMDEAPSVLRHRTDASPALDRIVQRCLRKDVAERWQSAADVAFLLGESARLEPESRSQAHGRGWRVVGALAGVACIGALAGIAGGRLWLQPGGRPTSGPTIRSHIDLPADAAPIHFRMPGRIPFRSRTQVTINGDGTALAWAGSPDGAKWALYVQQTDGTSSRRIAGTDDAGQPFFSPDGRWIGFVANGKLRKVPADGGTASDLADTAGAPMGASWSPDGRIFLGGIDGGLAWVPDTGGALQGLTQPDSAREAGHKLPAVLPGGRALLFTTMAHTWGAKARVEALVLASGARKVLVEDCADGRYLASGHLVCLRRGTLVAATFDPENLELSGPVVPVLESVMQALNMDNSAWNSGAGQFAVSTSGLLAFVPGSMFEDPPRDLVLVDEAGRSEPLAGFDRPLVTPQSRFSPDGRQMALTEMAVSGRLWLFDLERGTERALSSEGVSGFPRWSPDGSRLVVTWSQAGPLNLWLVPAQGGEWTRLSERESPETPGSWSPDGAVLAFVTGSRQTRNDIFMYDFAKRQAAPFIATEAAEGFPEFSPNGRWLAYASDESGRMEVYVTSFPDRKLTLVVSAGGGGDPAWSPDGRRLFFLSTGTAKKPTSMLEVPVRLGDRPVLGKPRALFALPPDFLRIAPSRGYDVHPDGRRFLFSKRERCSSHAHRSLGSRSSTTGSRSSRG